MEQLKQGKMPVFSRRAFRLICTVGWLLWLAAMVAAIWLSTY